MNFLCEGLCQRKVFPNMKPPWKGVLESLVGCFVPTGTAYVSLELLHSIAHGRNDCERTSRQRGK